MSKRKNKSENVVPINAKKVSKPTKYTDIETKGNKYIAVLHP